MEKLEKPPIFKKKVKIDEKRGKNRVHPQKCPFHPAFSGESKNGV
jgi:hypothetical protein